MLKTEVTRANPQTIRVLLAQGGLPAKLGNASSGLWDGSSNGARGGGRRAPCPTGQGGEAQDSGMEEGTGGSLKGAKSSSETEK